MAAYDKTDFTLGDDYMKNYYMYAAQITTDPAVFQGYQSTVRHEEGELFVLTSNTISIYETTNSI
jgi:hypothetical protein